MVGRVVGASAPELSTKVQELMEAAGATEGITERLKKLVSSNKVLSCAVRGADEASHIHLPRVTHSLPPSSGLSALESAYSSGCGMAGPALCNFQ